MDVHATLPRFRRHVYLVLAVTMAACSDDPADVEIDAAFIGNWVATSFIADGEEFAEGAFNLSFGFFSDGSYQLIVSGDSSGLLCDGPASCNDMGDFTYSGNVLTIDPGTADELDLQYSATADTLTVSGTLDGVSFTAVLERI